MENIRAQAMKCPKCRYEIPRKLLAKSMGKKGGLISGSKPRTEAQITASKRNLAIYTEHIQARARVRKLISEIEEEERQEEKK